jgi:hypothetical protein
VGCRDNTIAKTRGVKGSGMVVKNESGKTACLEEARGSQAKLLRKQWHLAKELQLNPHNLRNEMCLSKDESGNSFWQMAVEGRLFEILEELSDWTK